MDWYGKPSWKEHTISARAKPCKEISEEDGFPEDFYGARKL